MMMATVLDKVTRLPGWVYLQMVRRVESQMGYKVVLNSQKPNWIDGAMIFDMTPVWKKHGIDAKGVNYYTVGAVKDGLSSRYDYLSPYYQAWLGGYVVKFKKNREWTAYDHFHLGEADQLNWLEMYGDKEPLASILQKDFKLVEKINISGFPGILYEGGGWSHSDVGKSGRGFILSGMMAACANMFNMLNKNLDLVGENFIPQWNVNYSTNSYHKVNLWGYVAILELDAKTKAVLYANATRFEDRNGKEYDYFIKIGKDIKRVLLSTRIEKV
ncbi:MAG: hypothetical protein UX87_C0024G0015 [Candidatus Amesbacteria bacterium GW2011_GWA1_47_16]|uniref:Uncharacterized protein n=1 Tax=Candidatus Amesbacteria bacterium GW2011_GWA1_47_16 TaxID=1618353 RepID=A0A0G1S247_9BACT|nr:MAG: hypothetical protein UX87_C0024G0015 [Candidatus Amesbacteria bacterium GW2011_GWA1_47_16]HLE24506.1 hypothetical protein [Thermodesulfobacteriota bacterium]